MKHSPHPVLSEGHTPRQTEKDLDNQVHPESSGVEMPLEDLAQKGEVRYCLEILQHGGMGGFLQDGTYNYQSS